MPTVRLYRSCASVGLASGYLWSFHPIPGRIGSARLHSGELVPICVEAQDNPFVAEIHDSELGMDAHTIAARCGITSKETPCSPQSSASSSARPAGGSPPSSNGAAPRPSADSASDDEGFRSVNPAVSPAGPYFLLPPGSPDAFDWDAMAEAMERAPWELTDAKRRFGAPYGRLRRVIVTMPPAPLVLTVDGWDEVHKQAASRGWGVVLSDRGIELTEREQTPV